jgi:hypothetical protein
MGAGATGAAGFVLIDAQLTRGFSDYAGPTFAASFRQVDGNCREKLTQLVSLLLAPPAS